MEKDKRHFALSVTRNSTYDRTLIDGVADFAQGHENYQFLLIPPERLPREIQTHRFDGIICRLLDENLAEQLSRLHIPIIDLLNSIHHPSASILSPDNIAIGRLAAEHFLERRFTRFAFFGYRGITYSEQRRDGFLARLKKDGFTAHVYEVSTESWRHDGFETLPGYSGASAPDTRTLVRRITSFEKPIAAFCCHDPRAACLLKACKEAQIKVPNDVAILGVDDDSVYCTFSSPRLSSIDPSACKIGYEAARMLVELAEQPVRERNHRQVFVPPRGISVRESSEVYPVKPEWLSDALVFIKRQATSGISAADVFAQLGLSHTIVQSTFRRVLNTSVQREIIDVRMEEACRQLKDTSTPISGISKATGFGSPRYFCQTFARIFGCSPTDWRETFTRTATSKDTARRCRAEA